MVGMIAAVTGILLAGLARQQLQAIRVIPQRTLQSLRESLSWITLFDLMLHLGLLVGVLSLAVVGIRATVERRSTPCAGQRQSRTAWRTRSVRRS